MTTTESQIVAFEAILQAMHKWLCEIELPACIPACPAYPSSNRFLSRVEAWPGLTARWLEE